MQIIITKRKSAKQFPDLYMNKLKKFRIEKENEISEFLKNSRFRCHHSLFVNTNHEIKRPGRSRGACKLDAKSLYYLSCPTIVEKRAICYIYSRGKTTKKRQIFNSSRGIWLNSPKAYDSIMIV